MLNTGKLAGRTIFISGASRGIGKEIALKAARDGANIIVAAKTAEPHPKLSGTVYTAAKEIEEAGGQCLPCIADVRNEDQMRNAVESGVKQFGGIDILINNASAISLTGTLDTSMKTYDLMHNINTRGTFLTSQLAIPYLKSSKNPHILNISPPLNMKQVWFQGHVAYTMAKYGMSMCVLGMSGELKKEGIAVNALWPKTAIITAAMEMLGGKNIGKNCRLPSIMADAAYVMMTKDSRAFTGNFCVDEELLSEVGVSDFDQYATDPKAKLIPDYFLDLEPEAVKKEINMASKAEAMPVNISSIMDKISGILNDDIIKSTGGVFSFETSGDEEGKWYLDLKNAPGSAGKGDPPSGAADCVMKLSSLDFVNMFTGKINPTAAFMQGKLKISGNLPLAMKLEKLMAQLKDKL